MIKHDLKKIASACLMAWVISITAVTYLHASNPDEEDMLLLTNDVLRQVDKYVKFQGVGKDKQMEKVLEHIAKRKAKLLEQLEKNPEAVMRYLLPEELTQTFPDEIKELLEAPMEVEGELEVSIEDYFEEGRSKTIHALRLNDGKKTRLRLHFAKEPTIFSNGFVKATGIRIGNRLVMVDERSLEATGEMSG